MKHRLLCHSCPNQKGYTLVELLITIAVVGIISSIGAQLMIQFTRFHRVNSARAELQKDARIAIDAMNRNLRQASAISVVIDQETNQPPYSRMTFTKINGDVISYYQENKNLYQDINGAVKKLTDNLRYIAFSYQNTSENDLISISIALEKGTYETRTNVFKLSIEKIRIMN